MALVHDVIPPFQLFQPGSIDDALDLLDARGAEAWVIAGGMDSFDWLKDRTKRTSAVVELSQVAELRGIRDAGGGLEIGAMTTLTEVAEHPLVRERFGLLAEAAGLVASPQIRNQGTLGGNVSQDTRCWYYRRGWSCYRAGGNICYADTPTAVNREHAILGADRCVAVSPSDTAPALIALDAQMVIRRRGAERVVERGRLLPGPRHRHHAHDGAAAGRAAHRHPHPGDVGRGALLLREGARSPGVGLPAGERRLGDQGERRTHQRGAHRRRRRGGAAAAADGGGSRRWPARRSPRRRRRGPASWPSPGPQALRFNAYKIPLMRNLVRRAVRGGPLPATT